MNTVIKSFELSVIKPSSTKGKKGDVIYTRTISEGTHFQQSLKHGKPEFNKSGEPIIEEYHINNVTDATAYVRRELQLVDAGHLIVLQTSSLNM